jgi:hypothetical protein
MDDELEGGMIEGLGPHGRPQRFYVVAITRTPKQHLTLDDNADDSPDPLHDVPLPRKSVEKLFADIGIDLPQIIGEKMEFEEWPSEWKKAATGTFNKIEGMDRLNIRGNGEGHFRWDIRRQRLEEQPENVLPPIQALTKGKAILRLRTMWDFFRKMNPELRMLLLNYDGEFAEDGFASLPDDFFTPWSNKYSTEIVDGGILLKPVAEDEEQMPEDYHDSAQFRNMCMYAGAEVSKPLDIPNWTYVWSNDDEVDAARYALGLGPILSKQASIMPTETRHSALFHKNYTIDGTVDIDDVRNKSNVDGNIAAGITSMLEEYGMSIVPLRGGPKDVLEECFAHFGISDETFTKMAEADSSFYSSASDGVVEDKAFAGAYALMHGDDIEAAIWLQTWDKSRESKAIQFVASDLKEGEPVLESAPYYGGDVSLLTTAIRNALYVRACGSVKDSYRRWLPYLQVWAILNEATHPYSGLVMRIPWDGKAPNMAYITRVNEYLGVQRAFQFDGTKTEVRSLLKKLESSKESREDKHLNNFQFSQPPPWSVVKIAYSSPEAEKVALEAAKKAGITKALTWKNAAIDSFYGARIYPTAEQLFGMYILLRMNDALEIAGGYDSSSSLDSLTLTSLESVMLR